MEHTQLSSDELPALFRSADALSVRGQINRKRFLAATLAFDVAASAMSGYRDSVALNKFVLLALILGLSLTIWLLLERPETEWYLGRSLAESVKTLAWRYMMCSEPYVYGLPDGEAERSFIAAINRLVRDHPQLGAGLIPSGGCDVQVTQRMRSLRVLRFEDRLSFYVRFRIQEQQQWYRDRGERAALSAKTLKRLVVAFQALACVIALLIVLYPSTGFSAVGLLTTVVASLAAWQQLSQSESLAQAYGIAAQELASAQSLESQIKTEQQFSDFVSSVERAVSREHTMWLARRNHP
jgi:hypothetical protein